MTTTLSVLLSDSIEMIPCHMALSEQCTLTQVYTVVYNNTTLYVILLMLVPLPPLLPR